MSNDDHHRLEPGSNAGESDLVPQAPPGLVAALRDLERNREPVFVPRELDRAILTKARAHLDRTPPFRPWTFRWFVPWFATATAIVLLAWLADMFWLNRSKDSLAQAKADMDGNGRVDILDAFFLARTLKDGSMTTPPPDINGDGGVDQEDVDAIAALAVRLENKS